jgi:hypothetical protein
MVFLNSYLNRCSSTFLPTVRLSQSFWQIKPLRRKKPMLLLSTGAVDTQAANRSKRLLSNKLQINITQIIPYSKSRDRAVSIATGYGLDNRGVGVQVLVGSRIFSSPCRPDQLWGAPNLLPNGYQGIFPQR